MTTRLNYRHLLLLTIIVFFNAQMAKAQWSDAPTLNSGKINVLSKKGEILYAGTDTGGIYTSTNFGVDWEMKNNGITNKKIIDFVLKDDVFIAGVGDGFGGAIFISNDQAASWQVPNQNYNGFLYCLEEQGDDILAGTWYGVAKSTDDGDTWNTISINGLPSNASVNALLANGTTLFAAVGSSSTNEVGMYRSTDNGNLWEEKNTGITNSNFTALAQVGTTYLVATKGGGVFRSTNNGESWTAANSGLSNMMVNCLYASGNNVLAGTNDGVFLSTDNANSWTNISTGLPQNTKVNSITNCGSFLFLGTDTQVWRRSTAEVITHAKTIPSGITFNVYPNPSQGAVTVVLPESTMEIKVITMHGQVIFAKSHPENKEMISLQGVGYGIYLISIETDAGIMTKKITVSAPK